MDSNYENTAITDQNKKSLSIHAVYPLFILLFLIAGFTTSGIKGSSKKLNKDGGFSEYNLGSNTSVLIKNINILTESDISSGIKDTIYTDKECWLELRIDQQMLYQHWRDGKIISYPISSGNKFLSRSVESRPGLFAIFHKNEHHQSSQYNNADMYHFMPFNQGIGFHSLNGTGYYSNLGARPSSHGCIRMRHEDAKKLFKDCPLGTIVIAHRGYTARTIGFAPEGYEQNGEISNDEMKYYIAENLQNVLDGNYFLKEKKFFVINPKIIPVSGIYISYDKKIPEIQKVPKSTYYFLTIKDRLSKHKQYDILDSIRSSELLSLDTNIIENTYISESINNEELNLTEKEVIKKYFHNPIGILPYFPPEQ